MKKTPKTPEDMKKPLADMHKDGVRFTKDLKAKKERREQAEKEAKEKGDS